MEFTDYDTRLAAYAVIVDGDRILLSWYNGQGRGRPGWSLPGGGVEYEERVEEAIVREVYEETGLHVRLGRPLAIDSFTDLDGPRPPRPYKSVRVIFLAEVVGGTLGTVEVGGSTDRAEWVELDALGGAERADVVDVAVAAWRAAVLP